MTVQLNELARAVHPPYAALIMHGSAIISISLVGIPVSVENNVHCGRYFFLFHQEVKMKRTNPNIILSEESGQGMIEYSLIIAFVAVLAVSGFKLLGKGSLDHANAANEFFK